MLEPSLPLFGKEGLGEISHAVCIMESCTPSLRDFGGEAIVGDVGEDTLRSMWRPWDCTDLHQDSIPMRRGNAGRTQRGEELIVGLARRFSSILQEADNQSKASWLRSANLFLGQLAATGSHVWSPPGRS